MVLKVFLLLSVFCTFTLATKNKWQCADYYWRDYIGTTPYDAVSAGTDHEGNPRYIGLVYNQGFELLPATILPKPGLALTTAYRQILSSLHIKILCSPYEEAFEWIHVESKDLHDHENRCLIPGGSEVGEDLYIGRAFRNNDVMIGKIFKHERENRGIWFTDGRNIMNDLVYEVLAYDCNKTENPKFDISLGPSYTLL